jgi:signal transduction histidine kinase
VRDLAFSWLPNGIASSDVGFISFWTLVSAVIITIIGVATLRVLASHSVRLMVTGVILVSVLTSMAGTAFIAIRMLSGVNQTVVLDLMSIAGLAGLLVALVVSRQLTKASRAISTAVQGVGDSGVYIPPRRTLPAELAELSAGLTAAYETLAQARTRERALEASRRELVAWVSHDLRTPLAGLRAMAEALEDQVVTDPREVSQYHSQIHREVDRLTVMIDDLFELSRIHAGALRLSRRMVGLEDVVAEVVASAEPVARAKGVRLTGAAVRGMPVFIDSAEMGRALRNLVTNAIRHTPSDGTVDVLAEIQSGMACVSVADACGGIPPEDLPRVFDVAFRGESARTPGPTQGGGLGLSIARGIVEAHSGQIAVRNIGPGCQFLIRLPMARPGSPVLTRTGPMPAVGGVSAPGSASAPGPAAGSASAPGSAPGRSGGPRHTRAISPN